MNLLFGGAAVFLMMSLAALFHLRWAHRLPIYAGGGFLRAGGRPSIHIARWIPEIPLRIAGGSFGVEAVSLQVETAAGLKLRLDGTSDLSTWSPVQRATSFSGQETLTDTQPASHRRFYRVAAEP